MPRLSKVRIYSYVDFSGTFRKISILTRSKASGTLSSMFTSEGHVQEIFEHLVVLGPDICTKKPCMPDGSCLSDDVKL